MRGVGACDWLRVLQRAIAIEAQVCWTKQGSTDKLPRQQHRINNADWQLPYK